MWKQLLPLLPASALALDLQPGADIKELEGIKIPLVTFADHGRKVTWRPPYGWRMSYEHSKLVLIPPDRTHASMEFRVLVRTPGDREVLKEVDTLQKYCAAFLPKLSKNIIYRSTKESPFTIGELGAREYVFDFDEPGHPSRASICIVEYSDRERLVIAITAQPGEYEAVRREAIESMFSWQAGGF